MANTQQQFSAIQNKANSNSLVSQLFAGAPKNPANPFALAASSKVASPTAPSNTGYGTNGALMSVLPKTATPTPTQSTIPSLSQAGIISPPSTQPIKKQTVTTASGDTHTTEYHPPAEPAQTVASTGDKPNPEYITGSIGPGNTPTLPTQTPTQTPPVVPQNATGATQTPVVSPTPSPFSANAQPAATSAQGLLNTGTSQEQEAFTKAQALQAQLAGSQGNEATTLANMQGNPIPIEFQQGRGNIVQGLYNSQQQALASELQGESNLAGTGATLAGTGQTGLLGAGQLSTPSNQYSQVPFGTQLINSQGANVAPNGGLLSTDLLNQYATMAANGQYSAIPTSITGNLALNAQLNAAAKAINPNYNPIVSQAQGAATASNVQTQNTLNTNIGAQGAQQATQNYIAAKTSYDTASQQATNLQNTLATTGINNNPQFVNQKINALQNQLGSANYASFITALNETKQAYTSLLSSVGASTPTVNGQQATDIFNANSTPAQINAAIDALNTASYAKLKPLYDQISTYSNIGASGSGSSSSGSVSAGGYTFVKNAQGQWVAQ